MAMAIPFMNPRAGFRSSSVSACTATPSDANTDRARCPARRLEGGITTQIIEVIGICVAAGDGEDAQDVGKRVNNPRRVAPIGGLRGQACRDPEVPLRQRQQHHPAVRTEPATIEGGGDLLALNGRLELLGHPNVACPVIRHGGCKKT